MRTAAAVSVVARRVKLFCRWITSMEEGNSTGLQNLVLGRFLLGLRRTGILPHFSSYVRIVTKRRRSSGCVAAKASTWHV